MKKTDEEAVSRVMRLTAYIPIDLYKRLKISLIRSGESVSSWVRRKAEEHLKERGE